MAAPLALSLFSRMFLGFGKSAQAAKSFSQAGTFAAGEFSKGLTSNLVKGVNAANLGARIGRDLNHGIAAAFKNVANKRSAEMWGRTSAAMMYGGTGARATAAGNALKTYGGSAETYSQTMMGLQSRLTGLKYGNTGWLVEAMQKSAGLLNIRGSGENGFATGEELIRNLAKIKDQIPVGQFTAVANSLGLSADIQKSILDNNLDFLNKATYLSDEQQKDMDQLAKSQIETAKVWEKVSQEWGANTSAFWTGWEGFKQSIGEGVLNILSDSSKVQANRIQNDNEFTNEAQKLDYVLNNPFLGKGVAEQIVSEEKTVGHLVSTGVTPEKVATYATNYGLTIPQAAANIGFYQDNGFFRKGYEDDADETLVKSSQTQYEKLIQAYQKAGLISISSGGNISLKGGARGIEKLLGGTRQRAQKILSVLQSGGRVEDSELDQLAKDAVALQERTDVGTVVDPGSMVDFESVDKTSAIQAINDYIRQIDEFSAQRKSALSLVRNSVAPVMPPPMPSAPVDTSALTQEFLASQAGRAQDPGKLTMTIDYGGKPLDVNVHVDGNVSGSDVGRQIGDGIKQAMMERNQEFGESFDYSGGIGSQMLNDTWKSVGAAQ